MENVQHIDLLTTLSSLQDNNDGIFQSSRLHNGDVKTPNCKNSEVQRLPRPWKLTHVAKLWFLRNFKDHIRGFDVDSPRFLSIPHAELFRHHVQLICRDDQRGIPSHLNGFIPRHQQPQIQHSHRQDGRLRHQFPITSKDGQAGDVVVQRRVADLILHQLQRCERRHGLIVHADFSVGGVDVVNHGGEVAVAVLVEHLHVVTVEDGGGVEPDVEGVFDDELRSVVVDGHDVQPDLLDGADGELVEVDEDAEGVCCAFGAIVGVHQRAWSEPRIFKKIKIQKNQDSKLSSDKNKSEKRRISSTWTKYFKALTWIKTKIILQKFWDPKDWTGWFFTQLKLGKFFISASLTYKFIYFSVFLFFW